MNISYPFNPDKMTRNWQRVIDRIQDADNILKQDVARGTATRSQLRQHRRAEWLNLSHRINRLNLMDETLTYNNSCDTKA